MCSGETQLSSGIKEWGNGYGEMPAHVWWSYRTPVARLRSALSSAWGLLTTRKVLASGQQPRTSQWDNHELPEDKRRQKGGGEGGKERRSEVWRRSGI